LLFGSRPAPDQRIGFSLYGQNPSIYIDIMGDSFQDVKTNADGRFEVDHVPPGNWGVSLKIVQEQEGPFYMWSDYSYPQQYLQVKAGQITEVTLGGAGRTVVGRVILPPNFKLSRGTYYFSISMWPKPTLAIPDEARNGTHEQWYKWFVSPAGKAFLAAQKNHLPKPNYYAAYVRPDGFFLIQDVIPDTYTISAGAQIQNQMLSVTGQEQFTMPPIPGGVSDDVLVIPPIKLQLQTSNNQNSPRPIKPGDLAPWFSLKTLDGNDLNLADFHGKVVLLVFWGSWLPKYDVEVLEVKAIYKKFGADKRFVIIGLDVDDTPQPARDYVAKNGLPWPQGYVGPWMIMPGKTPIMDQYVVNNFPWYCLIGPDGRIIAVDSDANKISTEVQNALKQ